MQEDERNRIQSIEGEKNEHGWEQLAHSALVAYPITSPRITFIRHHENMTFYVFDQHAGGAYLPRAHTPLTVTFQGERLRPTGIVAELRWLEALADETNLILQSPVRTKEGALVNTVTGPHGDITCSLLHWIEADPFPSAPLPEQVVGLGTAIATLHTHARTWSEPESIAVRCMILRSIADTSTRLLKECAMASSKRETLHSFREHSN